MAMTPDDEVLGDERFEVVLACAGQARDLARRYEPISTSSQHPGVEQSPMS